MSRLNIRLRLLTVLFLAVFLCAVGVIVLYINTNALIAYVSTAYNNNTTDHLQYDADSSSSCYIYMVPMSFKNVYFHYWQALTASLQISHWSFECNSTRIYVPETNTRWMPLTRTIFGEANVFTLDKLNHNVLRYLLPNISAYFTSHPDRVVSDVPVLFYPLREVIESQQLSKNYTFLNVPFDVEINAHFINKALRQHTCFNDKLQHCVVALRKYLLQNILHINPDNYEADYYQYNGSITILNRNGTTRTMDTYAVNTLVNELRIHNMRTRVANFDKLPFREQVIIMLETTVLISPHGSGLINAMFLNPKYSIALEICPFYLHCHFGAGWRTCGGSFPGYMTSYNWKSFSLELDRVNCNKVYDKLSKLKRQNECDTFMRIYRGGGFAERMLFINHGLSRKINIEPYHAELVESIKIHFAYLKDLERARKRKVIHSVKKYKSNLGIEENRVNVSYVKLSWDKFIANYC